MEEITKSDIIDCLRNPSYGAYKGLKESGLTVEDVHEFLGGTMRIKVENAEDARNFHKDFVEDDLKWLGTLTLDGMAGYVAYTKKMDTRVSDYLAKKRYRYEMTDELLSVKESLLAIANYPGDKGVDYNRGSFTYGSLDFFIYLYMVKKDMLGVRDVVFKGNKGIIDCVKNWSDKSLADTYIAHTFARYMLIEYRTGVRLYEQEGIYRALNRVYTKLGAYIDFTKECKPTQRDYLPLFKKACEDGSIKKYKKPFFFLTLKNKLSKNGESYNNVKQLVKSRNEGIFG